MQKANTALRHPSWIQRAPVVRPFSLAILVVAACSLGCVGDESRSSQSSVDSPAHPELKNREIRLSVLHASEHPLVSRPVDLNRWNSKYDPYFRKYSKRFFGPGMDWRWFKSQAIAESELKHTSRGPQGAVGLMQIMPETFSQSNNELLLESHQERWHIAVAIQYNRWLWSRWEKSTEGDPIDLMLASYNAGRSRILTSTYFCGGCLSWERLQNFVPPVTRHYLIKIYALMGKDLES